MASAKRILVLGTSAGGGDWPPLAAVTVGLHQGGHIVQCFGDPAIAQDFASAGIAVEVVPAEDPLGTFTDRWQTTGASGPRPSRVWADTCVPAVRALVRDFRPHVVLSQLFTMELASLTKAACGLRWCCINPAYYFGPDSLLVHILSIAASQVTDEYFQLPVVDPDAVYRERVYCYELYHQRRCLWNAFPLSLGGEVDKAGHPHFRGGPHAKAKPDFLVHVPGEMYHNLATVEVKPATTDTNDLRADLQKLTWFCHHAQYFRGLLLVYGEAGERSRLQEKLRSAADQQVDRAVVMALYHRNVGQHAETIPW